MEQIHKRFTTEQIGVMLRGYCQGTIETIGVQETLGIGKTRFFALLKEYRYTQRFFPLSYKRATPAKLSAPVEAEIGRELLHEKELVENQRLPISGYNYSDLRGRLGKNNTNVSLTTAIRRAKSMGCYKPHRKEKAHDRECFLDPRYVA